MRKPHTSIVAGLLLAAAGVSCTDLHRAGLGQGVQAQELELVPVPGEKPGRHKFGVDWDKVNQDREGLAWHPSIIRCVEKWEKFPGDAIDDIKRLAYYSTLTAWLIFGGLVVLAFLLARGGQGGGDDGPIYPKR